MRFTSRKKKPKKSMKDIKFYLWFNWTLKKYLNHENAQTLKKTYLPFYFNNHFI